MLPLKLTKEHANKIMEMHASLAKKDVWFEQTTIRLMSNDKIEVIDPRQEAEFPILKYGWLEFCLNPLLRIICTILTRDAKGFNPKKFDELHKKFLENCFMYENPTHPVDFLYNQFKRIT